MNTKALKTITQILLLSVIALTPFVKADFLYFPYVSGKIYLFRLLVMLAFFFWIWLMARDKTYLPNLKNILVAALILFFLAQALVSFFGVDPLFSFFSSISRADGVFQYGFWLLYFLMLLSVFRKEKDWQALFSVFTIISLLLVVFAWLGYSPSQEIYGNLFGNPAYFAGFLLFSIGFSLVAFERKIFYPKQLYYFLPAMAAFFAVTLIFTQNRGAFIGLIGGISLFCILSVLFLRKANKKLAYSAGIVLLLSAISLAALFYFKGADFVEKNSMLSRMTAITDTEEPGGVRERLLLWQVALKAFREKPVFGWGPENFASAFNKYYDHGVQEAWFDRTHNQPLETLATGGIVLFSFYLFWLFAVFFLIFQIGREKKILSFLLASTIFAYFLQGFFLFDTFAVFLGLFPFLAFLVVASRQPLIAADKKPINTDKEISINQPKTTLIIGAVAFVSLFVIYTTVILPYKANAAALKFYTHSEAGLYQEAKPFLEKSFAVKSPYTYWQVRKETGWQFLKIIEDRVGETMPAQDIQAIEEIYYFITPELEKFIEKNPYEPQMYYVLARIYRAGFEKLNKDDLLKAESVLRQALDYSDLRKEYFEELKQVLLLLGKVEEAEKIFRDYAERASSYEYFPNLTLGHFYFEAEKYGQAIEEYGKAKTAGYDFCQIPAEYSRYMFSADKVGQYQRVVDMAKECLEKWGPDADTYFNIAVGYLNLEEKEKAKEFFLKAVQLDSEYERYELFFLD